MAALTTARDTQSRQGEALTVPMAAAVKLFIGSIAVLDASGNCKPGVLATGLTSLGIARATFDNSAGIAGAVRASIEQSNGTKDFLFANDVTNPCTAIHVGLPVYIFNDQTVTSLSTGASVAGKCMGVTAAGVWIRFPN
jgi:hypothetical protein